ncbi:MAG: 50S ribosomal protein L25/general stress protein Ctc [Alphaproteobacteria bacterium]|nr:50S ribosomal protein L25/general stress protein Ctc [Alphaproteobacteria bacterium]
MSVNTILKCELREKLGTGPARSLRKNGRIPAVVYGGGSAPLSVSLEEKEVTKLYRKHGFKSTIIELEINGELHQVLPKAVELHPTNELVRHADFVFLAKNGLQQVDVPILYDGRDRCIGLKRGGFFNIIHRKLSILCPVNNIPLDIKIDISSMGIGSSIKSASIKLPEGCSYVSTKNFILASVTGRGSKSKDNEAEVPSK